jgi:hypothetical protein
MLRGSTHRQAPLVLMTLGMLLVAGCSSGPNVVDVSGRVTRNGKPVPNLQLNFLPETGRPSWAVTDSDGRFTLNYSRDYSGGLVGKHQVWVVLQASDPGQEQQAALGRATYAEDLAQLVAEYGDANNPQIEVEIASSGQEVNLALDGGPVQVGPR